MPWSYPDNVPAVAQNWTEAQQRRCVEAANATLERTGDDEQAIYACITAAGKESEMERKVFKGTLELKADGQLVPAVRPRGDAHPLAFGKRAGQGHVAILVHHIQRGEDRFELAGLAVGLELQRAFEYFALHL